MLLSYLKTFCGHVVVVCSSPCQGESPGSIPGGRSKNIGVTMTDRYAKQELVRRLLYLQVMLLAAGIPCKPIQDAINYIAGDSK